MSSSPIEDLISYLVQGLVDKPDQVKLRESSEPGGSSDASSKDEGGRVFELQVSPEDMGKVIGRDGRTVNAVRILVSAAAQRMGEKVRLEILDERKSPSPAGP